MSDSIASHELLSYEQSLEEPLGKEAAELMGQELNIYTVSELLSYIPFKYDNRGTLASQEELIKGERITVYGTITGMEFPKNTPLEGGFPAKYAVGKMKFFRIVVKDSHRTYHVSFFNPRKLLHVFKIGQSVVLDGTVDFFRNQIQLAHPEWIILPEQIDAHQKIPLEKIKGSKKVVGALSAANVSFTIEQFYQQIIPHYRASAKLTSWEIWALVRHTLEWAHSKNFTDPLSEPILHDLGLLSQYETWDNLHAPQRMDLVHAAQKRVACEEALSIQLALVQRKEHTNTHILAPQVSPCAGGLYDNFITRLPFNLTAQQQQVLEEITTDLSHTVPMNRLLQGEVGSGKTIVALLSMLHMLDAGYQCCFLAPTEVLAQQHFHTIGALLGDLSARGELFGAESATSLTILTGSLSTAAKRQALLDIVSGSAGIIIGTHALLEEKVEFFNLGYIIIDEQHRFGVEQREKLRTKNTEKTPHVLVMTATPIPRTVALTRYGDLDVSVIDQLPQGRQPISTIVVPLKIHPSWWGRILERIHEEVKQGRQVYIVCPQINQTQASETPVEYEYGPADVTYLIQQKEPLSAQDMYDYFDSSLGSKGDQSIEVGLLHGQLSAEDKKHTMEQFSSGHIHVLISTTVIEVGVDVPNASMILIMDADRFGVSQLHQLRGRVGRGGHPGLCLLVTRLPMQTLGMNRLDAVANTQNGFELSLIDLTQRREGDVLGDIQSGNSSSFKALSLLEDEDIISYTHDLISKLYNSDSPAMKEQFLSLRKAYSTYIASHKLDYLDKA